MGWLKRKGFTKGVGFHLSKLSRADFRGKMRFVTISILAYLNAMSWMTMKMKCYSKMFCHSKSKFCYELECQLFCFALSNFKCFVFLIEGPRVTPLPSKHSPVKSKRKKHLPQIELTASLNLTILISWLEFSRFSLLNKLVEWSGPWYVLSKCEISSRIFRNLKKRGWPPTASISSFIYYHKQINGNSHCLRRTKIPVNHLMANLWIKPWLIS